MRVACILRHAQQERKTGDRRPAWIRRLHVAATLQERRDFQTVVESPGADRLHRACTPPAKTEATRVSEPGPLPDRVVPVSKIDAEPYARTRLVTGKGRAYAHRHVVAQAAAVSNG